MTDRILDRTEVVFLPGAAGAGTITFRGEAVPFENVKLITNVTRGVIIYQFNSTTRGSAGYNEVTNVLTLDLDTSTHSATDVLSVIVEDPELQDAGFTRIGAITPEGYDRGLRVNNFGGLIIADNEFATKARTSIGTLYQVETTGYNSISVQLQGTFSATVTFQVSNDLTTWTAVFGWAVGGGAAPVTSATAAGQWIVPAVGRFFRLQVTAYTSGQPVAITALKNQSAYFPASSPSIAANSSVNIVQVASGNLAAEDAAATTVPMLTGGVARTALPAATVVAGDVLRQTFSLSGQLITKQFAPNDLDFYVNVTVTTNVQTQIRAAQGAGIRQNVTSVTYQNTNTTATTLTIQDGNTTLVTFSCPASMTNPVQLVFTTPLRGTGNTPLQYTAGTTGANVLLLVCGFNSY